MKKGEMGMTCSIQGQYAFYVSKSFLNIPRKFYIHGTVHHYIWIP